ncbi:protein trichome birefringence-like 41 [Cucumis melo var. makuwa]|nr:protein trichome birefringence-like 41 [Cucumis melo var. makuwa]
MVFGSGTIILLLLLFSVFGYCTAAECNFFAGSWVVDETYPLYTAASCPFVEHEFSCVKNGRPDLGYTKYRWQPLHCDLSR